MGFSVDTGSEKKVKSEPNVVPLCDVLLVLLIIFMIVTPLIQKGVEVQLPNAQFTSDMPDDPELVLAIRRDGSLYLKEQKVELENLQNVLEEALLTVTDRKVYLRADQELVWEKMVDTIQAIRDAGIEVVGIITEKKTEKSE